jgi:intracellular multiplication protein IcmE
MVALSSMLPVGIFNGAGSAGPRRLVIIAGTGVAMVALVAGVSMIGHRTPVGSRAAPMPYVNPLPGGVNTNAEQDALAKVDSQQHASEALEHGQSYTPPLAASRPFVPPPVIQEAAQPAAAAAVPPRPAVIPQPAPAIHMQPAQAAKPVVEVAADATGVQAYRDDMSRLFQGYEGRSPRTEMVIDAAAPAGAAPAGDRGAAPAAAAAEHQGPRQVLVPGGSGVYAHTILAVSSDSGGPIVLQADSGPIAGDRMMGSFTREQERLVVTVHTLVHDGQTLNVNGLVIAADSMETAVASSVEEHYGARLVLPAAAAFVQGLGQAIATSNTTSQIGALGTVTGFTHLDLPQQAGVGAGAAAAQVGKFLQEAAPKGPTVNLASNVNVGVIFLSDVAIGK